jgi:hypothetical protein
MSSAGLSILKPAIVNRGKGSEASIDTHTSIRLFGSPEAKNVKVNFVPTLTATHILKNKSDVKDEKRAL